MVDFLPDDEQALVASSAREFLASELPVARLSPGAKAARTEKACWAKLAELGWFGIGIPEERGGTGYSVAEEALLFRECGRFLISESVLATALAAKVAAVAGDRGLLERLLRGQLRANLAVPVVGSLPARSIDAELLRFDTSDGDLFVAWGDAGMGVYDASVVREAAAGQSLHEAVPVERLRARGAALAWLDAAQEDLPLRAAMLLSASLAGICEATCDMAVDYAKLRQQFGQAIGAFQAIKHRCADMKVRAEVAWGQAVMAVLTARDGHAGARLQVRAAQLVTGDYAIKNAAANIQIHGGIGFTTECHAHHFLKRAHILDLAGGVRRLQRELLDSAPRA